MENRFCLAVLKKNISASGVTEQILSNIKNSIKLSEIGQLCSAEGTIFQHKLLLKITSPNDFDTLQVKLQQLSHQLAIDLILKPWADKDIKPGLLIMDMDSTLVQAETIDEIARIAGVGDKVAQITESAMRGELDFTESLIARVSMLKGVSLEMLDKVHDCLPLTEGAICLLQKAKENGCHTALVSGGFTLFAGPIAAQLSFDTLSANTLEFENETLTGKVTGDIVDAESKLKTLKHLQHQLGIKSSQIVAIGDGANDLLMLSAAGTGIAFHAKPKVQEQAKTILNFNNLDAVRWFLNW